MDLKIETIEDLRKATVWDVFNWVSGFLDSEDSNKLLTQKLNGQVLEGWIKKDWEVFVKTSGLPLGSLGLLKGKLVALPSNQDNNNPRVLFNNHQGPNPHQNFASITNHGTITKHSGIPIPSFPQYSPLQYGQYVTQFTSLPNKRKRDEETMKKTVQKRARESKKEEPDPNYPCPDCSVSLIHILSKDKEKCHYRCGPCEQKYFKCLQCFKVRHNNYAQKDSSASYGIKPRCSKLCTEGPTALEFTPNLHNIPHTNLDFKSQTLLKYILFGRVAVTCAALIPAENGFNYRSDIVRYLGSSQVEVEASVLRDWVNCGIFTWILHEDPPPESTEVRANDGLREPTLFLESPFSDESSDPISSDISSPMAWIQIETDPQVFNYFDNFSLCYLHGLDICLRYFQHTLLEEQDCLFLMNGVEALTEPILQLLFGSARKFLYWELPLLKKLFEKRVDESNIDQWISALKSYNINMYDLHEMTPLSWCVLMELPLAVKKLLEAGADPNEPNIYGEVPLHLAYETGNEAIQLMLLTHGADPNKINFFGESVGTYVKYSLEKKEEQSVCLDCILDEILSFCHLKAEGRCQCGKKSVPIDESNHYEIEFNFPILQNNGNHFYDMNDQENIQRFRKQTFNFAFSVQLFDIQYQKLKTLLKNPSFSSPYHGLSDMNQEDWNLVHKNMKPFIEQTNILIVERHAGSTKTLLSISPLDSSAPLKLETEQQPEFRNRGESIFSDDIELWFERFNQTKEHLVTVATDDEFFPYTKKDKGSYVGTIYQSKEDGSLWLGKLGEQNQFVSEYFKEPKLIGIDRSATKEKFLYDLYDILSRTLHLRFDVPKSRLVKLPIMNEFTISDPLAIEIVKEINSEKEGTGEFVLSIHVMSQWNSQYRDLRDAMVKVENEEPISFFYYFQKTGKFPDMIYYNNKDIPLYGLIELVACGKLLGDVSVLGNTLSDAGYLIREDELGQYANIMKVDPARGFSLDPKSSRLYASFNPQQGPDLRTLNNIQDIQIGSESVLLWEHLSSDQKEIFLKTMKLGLQVVTEESIIDFILNREGSWNTEEYRHNFHNCFDELETMHTQSYFSQ